MKSNSEILQQAWQWLDNVVIGLNLCPFAKKPRVKNQIKLHICHANSDKDMVDDFLAELDFIKQVDASETDTCVVIYPNALAEFDEYLNFLEVANLMVTQMGLEGEFQLASFHPNYVFDGAQEGDRENLTNTSPFPMIHIIREATVEKVLSQYPNPDLIPQNNIDTVENLSDEEIKTLYPFLSKT